MKAFNERLQDFLYSHKRPQALMVNGKHTPLPQGAILDLNSYFLSLSEVYVHTTSTYIDSEFALEDSAIGQLILDDIVTCR